MRWQLAVAKKSIHEFLVALQRMDIDDLGGLDVLQSLGALSQYSHVFGKCPLMHARLAPRGMLVM